MSPNPIKGQPPFLHLHQSTLAFYLLILVANLTACNMPSATTTTTNGNQIPTYQAPEPDYCSSVMTYSGLTSNLSGAAQYKRRELYGTFSNGGLGNAGSYRPIRHAEIRVTNSSGSTIQCGETDANGAYSLIVPRSAGTVTVTIIARANNNSVKAAVYDDPRYNNLYSVSGQVTVSTSTHTLSNINAEVTGSVMGAPFNMLDLIVDANNYLRSKVGSCSGVITGCTNFTVAPKVSIYWKLGFNPAEYYGSTAGISYYVPGYSRLFILGGMSNDWNSSDTDHFDNSVILHEYGHFLEDVLFDSDSPGGSHNGNKVIDPRLAWSEGWGNFFQAAVLNSPYYIDTEGNIDGSTAYLFYVDLESQTRDVPTVQFQTDTGALFTAVGEGNFREFSVTRFLWDIIDSTSTESNSSGSISDNISDRFVEIYHSLKSTNGWMKTSAAFRQIGHLHQFQSTLGATSWTNIHSLERHTASTADYAQYVAIGSSCASIAMIPAEITGDSGSYGTANLFVNNDFYHLKINSTQEVTLVLTYRDADNSGVDADLDLFLYNERARYGNSDDIIASSMKDPSSDSTRIKTESLTKTLSAGNYLINVMAFTGNASVGGALNYTLTLNGSQLCPTSLP